MNTPKNRFMLCLLVIASVLAVTTLAFSNEPINASDETINVIKLLEIANGDQDGNMNFDKEVTRAEFVKMAINASTSKNAAAYIKLNVSLFPDVKNSYWGAGYISVAINNGLVTGYIDGTFKPNNTVTLEEAATIVLRLLGYTNEDLIGSYPTAQLQKYSDLELDNNITAKRGDKMSREECMILLYNALSTKNKQGNVYCTTMGIGANSEGKLDYSALLEDKLDGPIIVKDENNIFEGKSFSENSNTTYYLNNSEVNAKTITNGDVIYYSSVINSVYAYRKTATGILDSVTSDSVTISGKNYAIASSDAKAKLSFGGIYSEEKSFVTLILGINDVVVDVEKGDTSKISDNDDNSSLLSMIDKTISKAVYISSEADALNWEAKIPFQTSGSEIYFNGSKTSDPSILKNDVIYYSKAFNSIWIYRKTVSGTIENISTVTSPTSVTVAGKTYSVASSDAAYALSVYGAYDVGDKVTLILGINDECVAVADTTSSLNLVYGVITATGEKSYIDKNGDEYTADYVTVTDASGTSYTYEYSNRYLKVGDAVKVAVSDVLTITKLSTDVSKGTAIALSNAIRDGKFSDDCEIIDISGSDVIKLKPSRIAGTVIDPEQFIYSTVALYYEFNANNYISKLILKNFTGDIDEYGLVTESSSGRIKYMTDKNEKSLATEGTGCSIGPAKLRIENGNIVSAAPLISYIDNISAVTNYAVYDSKDREYPLSDNVKVFIRTTTSYDYSKVSEVVSGDYKLTAYYDKLPEYGGRIRVIIATRNI